MVNPERRDGRALAVLLVTVASLLPIWQTTRHITDHLSECVFARRVDAVGPRGRLSGDFDFRAF